MNRRGFLSGILATGMAPAVVGSGILMPLGKVWAQDAVGATEVYWLHQDLLLRAELAVNPPVQCFWNGYLWTAIGETVSWSRVDDPTNFDTAFNRKELQGKTVLRQSEFLR